MSFDYGPDRAFRRTAPIDLSPIPKTTAPPYIQELGTHCNGAMTAVAEIGGIQDISNCFALETLSHKIRIICGWT